MTVVHVLGARPNFVKVAPVVHELRARFPRTRQAVVHTGQHYDYEMSQVFFEELDLPEPDCFLGVGSGGHGAQTGRALERLEPVLERERPALVTVAGDVNSTLAGALAAVKLGIPVAHIESGLRSFDRTMPEEINRVLVDQVATWCFIHSPEAEDNLRAEGVGPDRIHFVGNTMIDTIVRLRPSIERSDVCARLQLEPRRYLAVTLHRPRLVDGPLFAAALESLGRLSEWLPVVFPIQPRSRARLPRGALPGGLRLIAPLGYIDFLALESQAAAVITDSGGIQEEASYLRVPCFTLRDTTERPITLSQGTNRLLGLDVAGIERIPDLLGQAPLPLAPPAGWDGRAASRVVDVLTPVLASVDRGRPMPASDSCAESAAR
jgi:UDP-N-acetylglucosamine 2-epimerase (non-hydrolysing)